jgi:PAS domain S-box-containing protein
MASKIRVIAQGVLTLLFTLLTEPSQRITSPRERRYARLAASLFALAVMFACIQLALFVISNGRTLGYEVLLIAALAAAQYLCRTRWSRLAIILGLFLNFAIAPSLLFIEPSMDGLSLQLLLVYPVIGVLLTYLIFGGVPAAVMMIAVTIGMTYTILATNYPIRDTAVLMGYVIQTVVIAVVLIFLQRYEANAAQRKAAETHHEERRIRRIIDNIADIVLMTDKNFIIQYVNLAATSILGYEPSEFEGRSIQSVFEVMHPDDRDQIAALLRQVMANQVSIRSEYRLRAKGGRYIWLETICNFVRGSGGLIESVIFTGRNISERKAVEGDAQRTQRIYEMLVNSIDGVVWQGSETGQVSFVSRQVEDVMGFTPQEMTGSVAAALSRIHPDDIENVIAMKRYRTQMREDHRLEYRMITADGRSIWVRDTVRFMQDADGTFKVLGLLINISDLKEIQAAERAQRQLAEALRDSAAELTETVEEDEVLDRVLRQAQGLFSADCINIIMFEADEMRIVRSVGYDRFGIQPKKDTQEIALPDYASLHAETPNPAARHGKRLLSHVSAPIRVNGEVIGMINLDSAAANRFDDQTARNLQAFADQTSIALRNAQLYTQVRRYAEELEFLIAERTEALMKERRQLQTILNAMTEGVSYTEGTFTEDAELTTVYVNPALSSITGYEPAALMRSNLRVLLDPADADEAATANRSEALTAMSIRGTWSSEKKIYRADGRPIEVELKVTRVDDGAGNLVGAVTVLRDISEEKALAEQRERFIAHASHELRTPVTNLMTRLYLARKRPEQFAQHLDLLDEIAGRMKQLVDDLLDVSRMDRQLVALRREPLIIDELLRSVVRLQQGEADKKHIALSFEADSSATIRADRDRLTQVITNLIANAINYTPEGGSVTLCLQTYASEDSVEIIVTDTGIGIPAEHLSHIFKPFFRVPNESVSVKGSGLGLAISKEIIDLHGGSLIVESEAGKGSRFIVRLPLEQEAQPAH